MAQFKTSRLFDGVFVLTLLLLLGLAYLNRLAVTDWVFFATHQPNSRATTIADLVKFTPAGRQIFERGDAVFASVATIDRICDAERLGCLTEQGQIYVLDDPANQPQTVVTAAHEMLHLAYRRLDPAAKAKLELLLNEAINQPGLTELQDEITKYPTTTEKLDEAHSILGTEYASLPPALESYYRQYFADRSLITQAQVSSQNLP